ncbi:hypothetical protein B0J13DRAFT_520554 [Dactylonectria estremocensis]|uniref:Uncharacterized protein n=1 Tax=Dactylonectria estremocensis TaxID=1079267 RepID=A0A9P9JH84_9HYPO|nr:hypothetical protein B0J13DRAFT_520554 [Dactylonectria estremocensis]
MRGRTPGLTPIFIQGPKPAEQHGDSAAGSDQAVTTNQSTTFCYSAARVPLRPVERDGPLVHSLALRQTPVSNPQKRVQPQQGKQPLGGAYCCLLLVTLGWCAASACKAAPRTRIHGEAQTAEWHQCQPTGQPRCNYPQFNASSRQAGRGIDEGWGLPLQNADQAHGGPSFVVHRLSSTASTAPRGSGLIGMIGTDGNEAAAGGTEPVRNPSEQLAASRVAVCWGGNVGNFTSSELQVVSCDRQTKESRTGPSSTDSRTEAGLAGVSSISSPASLPQTRAASLHPLGGGPRKPQHNTLSAMGTSAAVRMRHWRRNGANFQCQAAGRRSSIPRGRLRYLTGLDSLAAHWCCFTRGKDEPLQRTPAPLSPSVNCHCACITDFQICRHVSIAKPLPLTVTTTVPVLAHTFAFGDDQSSLMLSAWRLSFPNGVDPSTIGGCNLHCAASFACYGVKLRVPGTSKAQSNKLASTPHLVTDMNITQAAHKVLLVSRFLHQRGN